MVKKTKTVKSNRHINVHVKSDEEGRKKIAKLYVDPHVFSANSLLNINPSAEKTNLPEMVKALDGYTKKIREGDLQVVEEMLAVQMQVLHAIFAKAVDKMTQAEYLNNYQVFGAMAMKAQNLTRMTAATLADMKNPVRATFIKNTAHNQQVNFGENFSAKPSNELLSTGEQTTPQLECKDNEAMDTRGTATPSGVNQEMETVEKSRG